MANLCFCGQKVKGDLLLLLPSSSYVSSVENRVKDRIISNMFYLDFSSVCPKKRGGTGPKSFGTLRMKQWPCPAKYIWIWTHTFFGEFPVTHKPYQYGYTFGWYIPIWALTRKCTAGFHVLSSCSLSTWCIRWSESSSLTAVAQLVHVGPILPHIAWHTDVASAYGSLPSPSLSFSPYLYAI